MSSVAERHAQILSVMKHHPYMTFKELADKVGVSAITIRRDMTKLEKTTQLKQAVGGIINSGYLDIDIRLRECVDAKRRIGAACAELVRSGQSLFIDAGSTTYYCLEAMKERPQLTTITYDMKQLSLLREMRLAEHYMIGGQFNPSLNEIMGPLAEEFLSRFRADVAIIGCTSIATNGAIACNVSSEVPIKRMMMTNAASVMLVADISKFERDALLTFGNLEQVDLLITDGRPPENFGRVLEKFEVKVVVA
jgi:DeoR/GlpR family transcriptional regulator of sugar metabolism